MRGDLVAVRHGSDVSSSSTLGKRRRIAAASVGATNEDVSAGVRSDGREWMTATRASAREPERQAGPSSSRTSVTDRAASSAARAWCSRTPTTSSGGCSKPLSHWRISASRASDRSLAGWIEQPALLGLRDTLLHARDQLRVCRAEQQVLARAQGDDDIDDLRGALGQRAHVQRVGDRQALEAEIVAQQVGDRLASEAGRHVRIAGQRRAALGGRPSPAARRLRTRRETGPARALRGALDRRRPRPARDGCRPPPHPNRGSAWPSPPRPRPGGRAQSPRRGLATACGIVAEGADAEAGIGGVGGEVAHRRVVDVDADRAQLESPSPVPRARRDPRHRPRRAPSRRRTGSSALPSALSWPPSWSVAMSIGRSVGRLRRLELRASGRAPAPASRRCDARRGSLRRLGAPRWRRPPPPAAPGRRRRPSVAPRS